MPETQQRKSMLRLHKLERGSNESRTFDNDISQYRCIYIQLLSDRVCSQIDEIQIIAQNHFCGSFILTFCESPLLKHQSCFRNHHPFARDEQKGELFNFPFTRELPLEYLIQRFLFKAKRKSCKTFKMPFIF